MADEVKAISQPVIDDQAIPGLSNETVQGSGGNNTTELIYTPEIPERVLPTQTVANTVISDSFDTQQRRILAEYSFSVNGAIAVGQYAEGISGDVRISPDGIVARNINGDITFTLDGTTGDATFKGTIAAGSLIAGRTDIGEIGGNIFIDGANNRIIISDGTHDRILIGYLLNGF